ncbi:MAG: SapC family protein [Xanthobacteraceae bacterium]
MPQFTAISRDSHAGKKWQRFKSYGFASTSALAPIVGVEMARAALAMPLAFFQDRDRFVLVAVLSLVPNRNMLVAPDGRWLGAYVPAFLRSYPFALVPKQGTDQLVLCIDTDSGLVVDGSADGEHFIGPDGNISPALKKVLDFLNELERSRRTTDVAVAALAAAGVIQPWPIKLKAEQAERAITGLSRIDEVALNGLTDDGFLKLRKASALPIASAQLLSMGQLGIFEHLARLQAQLRPPPLSALPENIDSLFELPSDDKIQFR